MIMENTETCVKMETSNFEKICSQYHNVIKSALIKNDANILEAKYKSLSTSDHDVKSPLDQAFRDVTLQLIEEADVDKLQQCVTLCIESCRKCLVTLTMPVVLLGDIFECLTLNKCEQMFTFVENGVNIWKEEFFFSSCRNNLLRLCNDLLRRLSRTQNTVFCGRILLFLAKFFPFSERSGLNIVSEFNLENITEYKTDTSTSLKDTIAELHTAREEKKFPIDFNLYCKFWALQDFFRNPNQCYNKMQWKTFASHSSNVLAAFSSCKLEDLHRNKIKVDTDVIPSQDEKYFAKFLTNQKLLELQLSDPNFRRCILLQFLILFQYLNSIVKFKSDAYELKPDQVDWIKKMTEMIYTLIEETPPDGEKFAEIVKHMLAREELWNTWKNDGCPEFKKLIPIPDTVEESSEERKIFKPKKDKRLFGDIMKEADANKKFCMGSAELTKLWNLYPDNLQACKAKERDFLPSLEGYFNEAIEQLDPSAMIEEEYKKVNDGNYGWRALRLLARRSPQFFTHSNNPIPKLSDYLEIMIKKIAKDKQDRNNSQETQEGVQQYHEMMEEILNEDPVGTEESIQNEEISRPKSEDKTAVPITQAQLEVLCSKLGDNWKKLAEKFGFKSDEITFFEEENPTNEQRVMNVIQLWFLDDEDANIENLCYILEGLDLKEISDMIKKDYIENP